MREFLTRRLPLIVALVLTVALVAQNQHWISMQDTPALGLCVRDPANLPGLSASPDGRSFIYLHTCGSRIYNSLGQEVKITGINWSGMEYGDYAPGGLGARKWQEIMDQIASLGYNTIRIPFSNEALVPKNRIGNVNFDLNPDLKDLTGLEMLDVVVAGARERGLKILLDRHRPSVGGYSPLWYTSEVPEERWLSDWRMLAARYYGNDTVIGVDLHNEPRGAATWGTGDLTTDWRLAAERAGNAVLEVNPYLLVFVEGIENYRGSHYWWGGNLQGVRAAPVRLNVPNRVVYSPHDYGPAVSGQYWFWDPLFPANLSQIWDRNWGYIQREGIAPVVVGEFGGRSVGDDTDGKWQTTFITYLRSNNLGAMVWSINPSWDTGGVLAGDWKTIEEDKQQAYNQILAPPLDVGALGVFGKAPTSMKVLFRQRNDSSQGNRVSFTFQIVNDGPDALALERCELRYWLKQGCLDSQAYRAEVDSLFPSAASVLVEGVSTSTSGQNDYLQIRFAPEAREVERYGTSREIGVRFPKMDWPGHDPTQDTSFTADPKFREHPGEWERVTLYLDGKLVWGVEP